MDTMDIEYSLPPGVHKIPPSNLDSRPDAQIDHALLHATPTITNEKNIWFFWHAGYKTMHPYTKRNIRSWYRRFTPQGWTIRVLDDDDTSPLNISNYLDTTDPETFPEAFREKRLSGKYALQHTSDLVRFPLLLKYGGVYADVGLLQIGDLDRLWNETVGSPASGIEVLSYNFSGEGTLGLTNYFLGACPGNAFFERCHRLFLAVWEGRQSTEGLWRHPLLRGVPLLKVEGGFEDEDGREVSGEEAGRMLTDYIIQGQVVSMVMGLVDEEGGWDGPEYVARCVYAIDFMVGSQLVNEMTAWDGVRAFELMSLSLPGDGEMETDDQRQAREIVEACLSRSFAFKLAHGLILRVLGETLGSLWRKHEGSDDVPNTYAHWLRYGIAHWNQDELPPSKPFERLEPFKRGPLLRDVSR